MLTLDGSHGEGGGQLLRTALGLAVALRRPVAIHHIRARRPRPGLQPQHLGVVRALAAVSDAVVAGDALDSTGITFTPGALRGGRHRFDIGAERGSAGSVSLLFQAVLLPLLLAREPSELTIVGGTHVPWSPTVHYLREVFLPLLGRLGIAADLGLERWGWYPRGGGQVRAVVEPGAAWSGLAWPDRGADPRISGLSAVSRLPVRIAERQRTRALERLAERGLAARIDVAEDAGALGPGTLIFLAASGERVSGGFSALGRRGVRAEAVADEAVQALLAYLDSGASVDGHLADQLVPFLALARTPSVYTCPVRSGHLDTVAWVVEQFGLARIAIADGPPARVIIAPAPGARP
jgi:RNA 3'-terminal phosphate cyclase (ATP)